MGLFDTNLGALLIGIFINTYLYGLVSCQYAIYVGSKHNDPFWIRLMVFTLFALDTLHSASVIYLAWLYAVENFTNPLALLNSYWPYPLTAFITACTAFLVQAFFAYRILKFTRSWVLFGLVLVLVVATFGIGLAASVRAWCAKILPDMIHMRPVLAAWLAMEVAVDVLIAAILLFNLSKSKTGYEGSDHVINRLMRMSIQTGLCAGVFAITCLIFFFASPETHFFAMFGIPISRVYTNTFMDTLLARSSLREMLLGKSGQTSGSFWAPERSSRASGTSTASYEGNMYGG